jgi:transposase
MELTEADYHCIEHCFPKHRGTVTYSNLQALNAILYIAENGAKWRKLPEKYGHWHTIYTRMRAWAKSGVLARVFEALQQEQIIRIKVESVSLDSTSIKVHPDGTGALKKTAPNPSDGLGEGSRPRFIWLPVMSGQHFASPSRRGKTQMDHKDEIF